MCANPGIWTWDNPKQIQQVARGGHKPGTAGLWVPLPDNSATLPPLTSPLFYEIIIFVYYTVTSGEVGEGKRVWKTKAILKNNKYYLRYLRLWTVFSGSKSFCKKKMYKQLINRRW